jgi:hypothetical protein
MQTWKLSAGDPLSLTLAADARLTTTEYTDDQIWELTLGGGEPAALALQTTFGLRAHWLRLFPRIVRSEGARTDPTLYHVPPQILQFSPNTLEVAFEPFEGLAVLAEYWIAESNIAVGRVKFTNTSILPLNFHFEWVALLNPIDRQGGMAPVQNGPTYVLSGETAYINPVVFLTGGPQPSEGPYPALSVEMELYPGSSRQLSWSAAANRTYESSLEAARAAAARPWEAEHTRLEMLNLSQMVRIQTGDPDWDAAFALTQKTAFGLLMKNPLYLPEPSFVLSRRPDQGFSRRGDGSDYAHLWSGQTALDAYYLSSLLLPGAPDLVAGLVRNFLAVQEENGVIDWKPGLGGQRSKQLAQPLIATLALQVAPYLPEIEWFREVFPKLLRFFQSWFSPENDRDEDGFPEWEHPLQSGLEDSPVYDRWSPNAQGIDVACLEDPGLAAMLYRECQSLIEMASALEESEKTAAAYARLSGGEVQLSDASEALPALRERAAALREMVESTWDAKARIYHYRDYQTHASQRGQIVVEFNGSERISSRKRFNPPCRLVIHMNASEVRTFAISITIHGFTAEGEASETLTSRSFTWLGRQARATTQNAFAALKRIEAVGLTDTDQVRVFTADLTQEDCSLFLPLWAGIPEDETARHLIDEVLWPRYLMPYGIPVTPPDLNPQEELPGLHTAVTSALLPWNHLIGEGLLRYGRRAQAADLLNRLMTAVIASLKEHRAFRQYYHAETGLAAGERGHLHGLAPLGLFLQTLGVRQLSAKEILLDGFNPFPWIIHVQYRKAQLTFHPDKTEIIFPGGQRITVNRPGLHRIKLS